MAAAADQLAINLPSVSSAPSDYVVPGSQEIEIQTVTATFDGTGASGAFLPALQIISDGGITMATFVDTSVSVAKGGSAEVTFGTFLRKSPPPSTTPGPGSLWGLPAWQSGCYYVPQVHGISASAFNGGQNNVFVYPIWIPDGSVTSQLVTRITSTTGAIRMGVYQDNGHGYPSALVVDSGSQTPGATGEFDVAFSHTFTGGLYWLAFACASGSLGTWSYSGSWQTVAATATLADYATGQSVSNYMYPVAFGAFPDPFPAGVHPHTFGAGYFVCLKAA